MCSGVQTSISNIYNLHILQFCVMSNTHLFAKTHHLIDFLYKNKQTETKKGHEHLLSAKLKKNMDCFTRENIRKINILVAFTPKYFYHAFGSKM